LKSSSSRRKLGFFLLGALALALIVWLSAKPASPTPQSQESPEGVAAAPTTPAPSQVAPPTPVSSPANDLVPISDQEEAKLSIAPSQVRWPVQSDTPVIKRGPNDPTRTLGEMVSVRVEIAGKTYELLPNYEGMFPPVYVSESSKSKVTVYYPESNLGDRVLVQIHDGGKIDDTLYVKDTHLDENKLIHFTFSTTVNPGSFRLTMRKDLDIKHLEFWVGPDIPIRQVTNR
jgi:hypothetical protein